MPGLGLIKGISEDAAELLEAAGVEKPLDLATQDTVTLFPHLQTASRAMKRPDLLPDRADVDHWINAARELVETISPGALSNGAAKAPSSAPKFRSDVGTSARLPTSSAPPKKKPAPTAPTSPGAQPQRPAAAVVTEPDEEDGEIAAAIEIIDDDDLDAIPAVSLDDADLFDDHDEDNFDLDDAAISAATAEAIAKTSLPTTRNNDADTLAHLEKLRARREVDMGFGSPVVKDDEDIWKNVDKSSFATFNDYEDGKVKIQPLERGRTKEDAPEKERVIDVPQDEKVSRLVRRGINYPHPVMAFCSALFVLFFRFYMVVMIIGLPIALIQLGDTFNEYWIPTAVFIGIFFLLGIINLVIISKVRCRVCSCPMFRSQRCFKNKKAHLLNGVGYVASLALHMVIFQWFRCMYCGTAIRVRGAGKTTRMEVLDAKALDVHDMDDDDPIRRF
ncbi:MAG: hypothetical protein ACI9R3_001290 [Verrucomicrobiales bacterium]|jgi:hypothetical protein